MGLLNRLGLGPEPTLEEQQKLREFRQTYLDYLASEQGRTVSDQTSKRLTPESTQQILSLIKDAQTWLQKNPNANLLELQAARDNFTIELKRIRDIDKPKAILQSFVYGIPGFVNEVGKQKKLLSTAEQYSMTGIANTLNAWLIANPNKTVLDYNQKSAETESALKANVSNDDAKRMLNHFINNFIKQTPPETIKEQVQKDEKKAEFTAKLELKPKEVLEETISTAFTVFWTLLIIALCIFCGSLAANQAIGRDPIYRILYFIWGAFPLFAPFVAIQSLLLRLRTGPIPMFAILPISTTPAISRLGKLLMYPFYWIPDADSDRLTQQYLKSLDFFKVA